MEPSFLSERIEWEVRRVAASFGVESFAVSEEDARITFEGNSGPTLIWCNIDARTQSFCYIEVGSGGCEVHLTTLWPDGEKQEWRFYPRPRFHEIMARGLYCLGFEDEGVLARLPTLTAHEKLELPLSMPREFWPQK